MELKTLQDIECGCYCGECGREFIRDLSPIRQEAIKWIKEYEGLYPVGRRIFMRFFNITEKEVKK